MKTVTVNKTGFVLLILALATMFGVAAKMSYQYGKKGMGIMYIVLALASLYFLYSGLKK